MIVQHVWINDNQIRYVSQAFGIMRASATGDISSDLYRPQSQDEIVEFSFFVALSYESNLQLGCF